MLRAIRSIGNIIFALGFAYNIATAAEFHAVGRADAGWHIQFSGFGMSADGQVIVSGARTPDPGLIEAYRWSPNTGRTMLGFLNPTNDSEPESFAYAASADGSVIVGSSLVNTYHVINFPVHEITGFSLAGGNFTSLGWLSGDDQAYPLDITADGSMAVGGSWEMDLGLFHVTPWITAVKWNTITGAHESLGTLDNDDDSYAIAVSGDGNYIVGQSGDIDDWWRPFVWIEGNWHALGYLGSGGCPSSYNRYLSPYCGYGASCCNEVYGISDEGLYAVGRLSDGTNTVPVYWHTTQRTPNILPSLGGEAEEGAAFAWSDPSDVPYLIGGTSGGKAVLWETDTFETDIILVETLLKTFGLGDEISGWELTSVRKVSDDGKTIAGYSIHPNGQKWIWYADLRNPPPNDVCANAIFIGQSPYNLNTQKLSRTGTTLEATRDINFSCGDLDAPNVWYSYSAPVEGYLYLDLCGTTDQNWAIEVHDSCPVGNDNYIDCSNSCSGDPCDEPCMLPPRVRIMPGETYYIGVSSRAGGLGGEFTLNYQFLPINDACDDAFFLPTPSRTPGLTSDMTPDSVPACQDITATAPGVWYKVIGSGHLMTASLCGSADYDTKLSVYCSGCGGMTCVAANDDACGLQSSVSWCSSPGAIYHILVHGYGTESGSFWLDLSDSGLFCTFPTDCRPVNETCVSATPLSPGTLLADNTGANTSAIAASCRSSEADMWYTYTTGCDGEVYIDTCQDYLGSLEDTVLSVYDACGGTELACNDNYVDATVNCGWRSAVIMPLPPNTPLKIRVAGVGTMSDRGTFPLRVSESPYDITITPSPLPDALQGQPYSEQLSLAGGCPLILEDSRVWYFVGDSDLPAGLEVDGQGLLHGIPEVAGIYTFNVSVDDALITGTPGDNAEFDLRILPSNDDCADAIPITEGGYGFGTVGSTTDGPDEPDQCDFNDYTNIGSDIWFRYSPSCTGQATASLCGSAYDTKLAVYEQTCPSAASAIACNDDSSTCGTSSFQSQLTFDVTTGEEYLIRVGGFAGWWGNGELQMTCYGDCNGNGINDETDISNQTSIDCNGNAVPDECDCDFTGFAMGYGRTRCEIDCCYGDWDGDGDVDGVDLVQLISSNCF